MFQTNIKDIRSEPQNIPTFIMEWAMEIGRSIDRTAVGQKLDVYGLISLRQKIRFLHSHTRLRGDKKYSEKFEIISKEISELEEGNALWDADKNTFVKYFDKLMEWYELEAETYERFNLIPAEDEEFIWESPPWVEMGLVEK